MAKHFLVENRNGCVIIIKKVTKVHNNDKYDDGFFLCFLMKGEPRYE